MKNIIRISASILLIPLLLTLLAIWHWKPGAFVLAFVLLLVPAIAWFIGAPAFDNGVWAVFGLHAAFAVLFAGPALLFRKAARS